MPNRIKLLRSHPLIYKALLGMAVVFAIFLAGVLYVATIGFSIDASAKRGKFAALLTESLGREVQFDGVMQLEISAKPGLHVSGLHIANATGYSGGEFASLEDARLELNLWALLRLRLQVDELTGQGVKIRLQSKKDGSNNWTLKQTGKQVNAPVQEDSGMELDMLLARLDIERVSLGNLNLEFVSPDGKSHFFELQSLVAHFPAGESLTLALNGAVEKKYPYKLEVTGGNIADLVSGDKPWPVDLSLGFMSSRLLLKGNVTASTGELNFNVNTEDPEEFERLLQTKLPAVGVTRLSGAVKYAPGKVALNNLAGVMGKSVLNGELNFDYSGERPKVSGELSLPVLDLRPFMTGKAVEQEEPSQSLAQIYQEFAKATFNLKDLNIADADLTLHVGKWLNIPGAVHDATMQVKLDKGRLSVPVRATIADVKLSGDISADAATSPARFKLSLGTRNSGLGNLAGVLLGMNGINGQLGRFDLRIAARGNRGAELMESLDARLDVEQANLTYGNGAGGRPVRFSLDDFVVALPAGKALTGEAHGSLLGKVFSATLQSGSLTAIMQESHTPIDFELLAGDAKAEIHAILQPPSEKSGSEVAFQLAAPHSGEIANWLGLKSGVDEPIDIHGNFHTESVSWHLSDFALQLGRSALYADVQRNLVNGKPLIKLQLTGDIIDIDELESMLPTSSDSGTAAKNTAVSSLINIPILPIGINMADADITVRIKHITSSSPLVVHDLAFDGNIRDGMMSASPFEAYVGESKFEGAILLDLRSQQPHSVLWLSSAAMNIGSVLKKLGIAKNIDVNVDHLRLQLDLHSSRLGKLLAQSDLSLDFEGGHLTLHDVNTGGKMVIAIDNGELKSAAGAPVSLGLRGALDNAPVSIGIETANAVDLINPKLSIPFKLNASLAGATLKLAGDIDRPFEKTDIELALEMSGSRLDNLDVLAHTSLPPWGPWSATGKFHMSPAGYEVSSLLLKVGSSELNGHGKVDTKVTPPRIDIELTAPTIQLDDFRFGAWSPEKNAQSVKESQEDGKTTEQAQQLLSSEVLKRQNAHFVVRVDQVISGHDMLGNGSLDARLENGHAVIGPVVINTPGGSASLLMGYDPGEKDVAFSLHAEANHFDYGILARRIDKKSEMQGTFSLNVNISARAHYLSELLRYGKGNIDFEVWPENMKSGLLDIWAVNVLMALLPAIDSSNESVVNCAIGRFVLADGRLSDKTILIDTSRMRVTGKGGVDLAKEDIQLKMQPHAKTPQFLSFSIPVELSGNINDFHVGVSPADLLGTVGQLVTSVIWVPLQTLLGKETPADGRDVCLATELK